MIRASAVVLDSSATLAWVLPGERSPIADALLDHVAAHGARVPSLWRFEVANVLLIAQRRGRIDAAGRDVALARLSDLPITIDPHAARLAWTDISVLADAEGLTVYDATFLELAIRIGLPLATLDAKLAAGATRRGVEVVGI